MLTLVEVLTVLSIAALLAAITYPMFNQVRRSAQKAACISNLKQIGLAISIYRSEYGGSDVGTPAEMGLPQNPFTLKDTGGLVCHGTNPSGGLPGYGMTYSTTDMDAAWDKFWTNYVGRYGSSAVLIFDPSHQSAAGIRSREWENWTALGLHLDTSVVVRTRRGYPYTLWWWM